MIEDPEGVLADYHRWLYKVAADLLPDSYHDKDIDDLVNEGRIAMWRAMETYDESLGALPSWITRAARTHMRSIAHGNSQPTGRPATRGSREVDTGPSLDQIDDADALIGGALDSYLQGALPEFFDALTPRQREHVFLRFWCGIDPTSRAPEVRALVKQFPVLQDRWLWQTVRKTIQELKAS